MPKEFLARRPGGIQGQTHSAPCHVEPMEPRLLLSADVLTWHNSNLRTGLNNQETVLTPSDVNAASFGKLMEFPVDGAVYAQPLVKSNVRVPGVGPRNLVFVATEADSVYAFDSITGAQVWRRNFTDPAHGITVPTAQDVGSMDIGPQDGITSTPVIDPATNTLYVVTKVKKPAPPSTGGSGTDVTPDPNAGDDRFEIRLRTWTSPPGVTSSADRSSSRRSFPVPARGRWAIAAIRWSPLIPSAKMPARACCCFMAMSTFRLPVMAITIRITDGCSRITPGR